MSKELHWDILMLGLYRRAFNTVRALGCETIRDVTRLTAADILQVRGAWTATLAEIRHRLSVSGLTLRGE